MTRQDELESRVRQAIQVDEVGIETGRFGHYFLKTYYRPVFAREGDWLVLRALSAAAVPLLDGSPVQMRDLVSKAEPEQRLFLDGLCSRLHLRNLPNTGLEGIQLLLGCKPVGYSNVEAALHRIAAMAACLEELEIAPEFLVCEIGEGMPDAVLRAMGGELRRRGMSIAIDDFGVGSSTVSLTRILDPDMVKLSGEWFRRIAEVPFAVRLLASLVDALQREGRLVLIEGIEDASHLRTALDVGADLVTGELLAPAKTAGALIDAEPVHLSSFFAPDEEIPLHANSNQPR